MHHHLIAILVVIGVVLFILWHIFTGNVPATVKDKATSIVHSVSEFIKEKKDKFELDKNPPARKLVSPAEDKKIEDTIKKYYPDFKKQEKQ